MVIFPLRAAYGDALILESEHEGRTFRIVVDGGPQETADKIADHFLVIGHIDLLILTHYDEDHIMGVLKFFEQLKGNQCVVSRVWANCASIVDYDDDVEAAAYENAYKLSNKLSRLQKCGVIGEWVDDITTEKEPITIGPFQIDVLSPTIAINNELKARYEKYIEENGLQDDPDLDEEISLARVQCDASKPLDNLAETFKATSTTFMNKTSIALRIIADGKTVLLLGDADANVIADSLSDLKSTKDNPMKVDLIKMSHHGSKSNINRKLLSLIDCLRFLFTTNGGTGGAYHPDRQTIACLDSWLPASNGKIILYFNYPLSQIMERNAGLLSDEERGKFSIVDEYPSSIPSIAI